ncbi:hypothetical protein E2562_030750 [Oryza meyeriana var. granulata]|uniref:Uncharacterized protein n=1 Tax=Oryza meyeriana var. granulata TaxID=110450 RepID=A0A6G1E506_9ORYZ|nr:hypothetical protein E2562_030750 [Oryza meyeriana var. granulata]
MERTESNEPKEVTAVGATSVECMASHPVNSPHAGSLDATELDVGAATTPITVDSTWKLGSDSQ